MQVRGNTEIVRSPRTPRLESAGLSGGSFSARVVGATPCSPAPGHYHTYDRTAKLIVSAMADLTIHIDHTKKLVCALYSHTTLHTLSGLYVYPQVNSL